MKDLPRFKPRPREAVVAFVAEIFTRLHASNESYLRDLIEQPDGYYRAVFDPAYFALIEGQTQPSKSQWNSLKKKMKRRDERVFIFKAHGEIERDGQRSYYVDFGFMARRD